MTYGERQEKADRTNINAIFLLGFVVIGFAIVIAVSAFQHGNCVDTLNPLCGVSTWQVILGAFAMTSFAMLLARFAFNKFKNAEWMAKLDWNNVFNQFAILSLFALLVEMALILTLLIK